jgi:hypothetical protein
MDKDSKKLESSSDLLHLESKLQSTSESAKPSSLIITKKGTRRQGRKHQQTDPKPVKITRIDSTSILSRAKAFLDQVKSGGGDPISSSCDLQEFDTEEKELTDTVDENQPQVEVNLLLYPESAATKSSDFGKVTRLLGGRQEDSESSSSSIDSESDSSEDENDKSKPKIEEINPVNDFLTTE